MMKKTLIMLALLAMGCQRQQQVPDAYGNFEATEITVAAAASGKIQHLEVREGQLLRQGQYLGLIDTAQLSLRMQQLQAQAQAIQSRSSGIGAQVAVLLEQQKNAESELRRFRQLASDGAATRKQVDDLQAQIAVLNRQIQATRLQNDPLSGELQGVQAQIALLQKQMEDARILAPRNGTVLLKVAEAGEMVQAGMPLFRMASLDTLSLRAYISGRQLPEVRLGQTATVMIDREDETYHQLEGTVEWISEQAEFTPKTIQTREERTDLVYAVRISVANDGVLKIGMPAEVSFGQSAETLASQPHR